MVCSFRCDPCSLYLKRGAYPCTLWATAVVLALTPGTQSGTVPLEHPPVCTAVRGLTLSPQAKQLSVAVAGAEAVQVVDLTSQRAAGEILVGSSPQQVVTLPNGTTGLVVSRGPEIFACFDSRCYTVSQTIRVGTNPHGLAGSRVERTAYVAHEGSQDVSVVEGASSTVTATVHVGNAPRMIVVQPGSGGQGMIPVPTAQSPTHGTRPICDHGTLEVQG